MAIDRKHFKVVSPPAGTAAQEAAPVPEMRPPLEVIEGGGKSSKQRRLRAVAAKILSRQAKTEPVAPPTDLKIVDKPVDKPAEQAPKSPEEVELLSKSQNVYYNAHSIYTKARKPTTYTRDTDTGVLMKTFDAGRDIDTGVSTILSIMALEEKAPNGRDTNVGILRVSMDSIRGDRLIASKAISYSPEATNPGMPESQPEDWARDMAALDTRVGQIENHIVRH